VAGVPGLRRRRCLGWPGARGHAATRGRAAAASSGRGVVAAPPPPRGRGLVAAAAASSVRGAARPGLPSSPVAASGGQGRLAASSPPRVVGEGRLLSSDLCWD